MVRVGDDFTVEYPDADPSSTELFATLMRTGFVLREELDRVVSASLGINQAMTNTLAVIEGADEPLTPSEISERTLISSATMTSTLDRLERQGWIRRLPNPEDRRSVLVEVTEEGQALCDRFLPGIHAVERAVMADLDPAEREQLMELLGKMLTGAARVTDAEPMPLEGTGGQPPRNDTDPPVQTGGSTYVVLDQALSASSSDSSAGASSEPRAGPRPRSLVGGLLGGSLLGGLLDLGLGDHALLGRRLVGRSLGRSVGLLVLGGGSRGRPSWRARPSSCCGPAWGRTSRSPARSPPWGRCRPCADRSW